MLEEQQEQAEQDAVLTDEVSATEEVESTEAESGDDEVIVTIDGEESSTSEEDEDPKVNPWEKVRELAKENKALRKQQEALTPKDPDVSTLPEKPTLENCDYDESDYESKLSNWYESKRKYDEHQSKETAKQEEEAKAWQSKHSDYLTQKEALNVSDDVEQVVLDELSEIQQGVIVKHAKNAGMVVLALGRNPQKAKELASIKDPIEFALAVSDLERKTKVTKRSPPKPETTLDVSRGIGGGGDKKLAALREEASRTGNFDKVAAYRRNNNI